MWKKIAIAGSIGAVLLGAGTAALATTGETDPSASGPPVAGSAAPQGARAGNGRAVLRRALHGSWTTRDRKAGTGFIQHDAIRGSVTAVSPSAITVQAADGVTQTYAITSSTKVHVRGHQGTTSSPGDIHVGDRAAVVGTGSGPLTATAILDRGAPPSPAAPSSPPQSSLASPGSTTG